MANKPQHLFSMMGFVTVRGKRGSIYGKGWSYPAAVWSRAYTHLHRITNAFDSKGRVV